VVMATVSFSDESPTMIDRRALSLLLLGGAADLAGCASGEGPPPPGGRVVEIQADMLFVSPMGEPFRAKPPAPYPVDLWFRGADTNNDGKLDLDEFLADATRFFHLLDVNKDGVIDHREIFYYEHRVVPEMLAPTARLGVAPPKVWLAQYGGGAPGGGSHQPAEPQLHAPDASQLNKPLVGTAIFSLLSDPEPVQGCDIRLTGYINLNDFKTRGEQRFKLLDDENKGYLTLAGLPQTEAQRLMPHPRGHRNARA
jgi:hypothetical protein